MNSENSGTYFSSILLAVLLIVSIVLLTLQLNTKILALKKMVQYFIFPSVQTANTVVNYGFSVSGNILNLIKIQQEAQRLKKENEELIRWRGEYEEILKENSRLRDMLGFKSRDEYETIAMKIFMRDSSEWFLTCLCDKGSNDGVNVDDPVVAVQGEVPGLAGRVIEVAPGTSKILLLTDNLSSVGVTTKRTTNDGVVQGQGSSDLIMKYIIPSADIQIGDELVTAGLGGIFPPGIKVGTIMDISNEKEGDFRQAVVKPAINFNKLRELMIVKKKVAR